METQIELNHLPDRLLTASEVASLLNISRAFAYQLIQRGKIRTVRMGKVLRVRPEDLKKYIEEHLSPQS